MRIFVARIIVFSCLALVFIGDAYAVKIMTNPATSANNAGNVVAERFKGFALAPNGTTIVATANFLGGPDLDRVYSLEIPADPSTQTAAVSQISTNSFSIANPNHNIDFEPVISPDGSTVLFAHNGNNPAPRTLTIFTMPIGGELGQLHTGLFDGQGTNPNLASPGNGNHSPVYSPDGNTIFFLNENSGYEGSIPSKPSMTFDFQDWDRIYSVPATGGTVTAITAPGDGDIDNGLFKVTPNGANIIYARDNPDNSGPTPLYSPTVRGRQRQTLHSVSTSGGASTQIPLTLPGHDFDIEKQLELTSDGNNILFIADYGALGKNELWSLPMAGGTPTRVSDDIPWDGDVTAFAISPDGTQVAYAAGQNVAGVSELFVTPIAGGSGSSKRVSDAPPTNSGEWDVGTAQDWRRDGPSGNGGTGGSGGSSGGSAPFRDEDALGQVVWRDNSTLLFLGDFDVDDARDIHIVDTTEKLGLIPSRYTYVGAADGDYFDESNWQDAQGNSPSTTAVHGGINPAPSSTTNVSQPRMLQNLLIDGDAVVADAANYGGQGQTDFIAGASLEMTAGSSLTVLGSGAEGQFDTNPQSGFKMTDATLTADERVYFEGTTVLNGGTVNAGVDIIFDDENDTTIDGTTLNADEEISFDNSVTDIANAAFKSGLGGSTGTFGLRFSAHVKVTDTSIDVGSGLFDVETRDGESNAQRGIGSVLTLEGASKLKADAIDEGVSLVLDGTSVATLLHTSDELIDPDGTLTFLSTDAELITMMASTVDARALIINGLTGMSYLDDPSAWNFTTWDGQSILSSLKLLATGTDGDFDNDGDVDGADFLLWQRGGSPTPLSASDLSDWQTNYGAGTLSASSTAVPEPGAVVLFASALAALVVGRFRSGAANSV